MHVNRKFDNLYDKYGSLEGISSPVRLLSNEHMQKRQGYPLIRASHHTPPIHYRDREKNGIMSKNGEIRRRMHGNIVQILTPVDR
jgi:hypothetical protein